MSVCYDKGSTDSPSAISQFHSVPNINKNSITLDLSSGVVWLCPLTAKHQGKLMFFEHIKRLPLALNGWFLLQTRVVRCRMRQLSAAVVVLCLLACPAVSLCASWKQLGKEIFIDESTVRHIDAVVLSYKHYYEPQDRSEWKEILKSTEIPHYDIHTVVIYCDEKKWSLKSTTAYSKSGTVIYAKIQNDAPSDINPESFGSVLYNHVCPQR